MDDAGLPDYLARLDASGLRSEQPGAFAGILSGVFERFGTAEVWVDKAAESLAATNEILAAAAAPGVGNDVLLARWAVTGSLVPLGELARRALHRDGSSEADTVGIDAIGLLSDSLKADPLLASELAANNFSLARVRFGVYLPGSFSLPLPPLTPISKRRPVPVAGPPVGAAAKPDVGEAGRSVGLPGTSARPAEGPVPNFSSGTVDLNGSKLSVSAAVTLRDGLERAVVTLLRPAEGFAWLDDNADPQARSALVDLDSVRGKGLPDTAGGMLAGEVIQTPAKGQDQNAGQYRGRVYSRGGGYSEFEASTDDMNVAKFMVAERIRQSL